MLLCSIRFEVFQGPTVDNRMISSELANRYLEPLNEE